MRNKGGGMGVYQEMGQVGGTEIRGIYSQAWSGGFGKGGEKIFTRFWGGVVNQCNDIKESPFMGRTLQAGKVLELIK